MELHSLPSDMPFCYCGPAAAIALTGKTHREVMAAIATVRSKTFSFQVKGMTATELSEVLRELGVACTSPVRGEHETLYDFVKCHPEFIGVVQVTGHFVAVSQGCCVDNGNLVPVQVANFPGKRKIVRSLIAVDFDADAPPAMEELWSRVTEATAESDEPN